MSKNLSIKICFWNLLKLLLGSQKLYYEPNLENIKWTWQNLFSWNHFNHQKEMEKAFKPQQNWKTLKEWRKREAKEENSKALKKNYFYQETLKSKMIKKMAQQKNFSLAHLLPKEFKNVFSDKGEEITEKNCQNSFFIQTRWSVKNYPLFM